MPWSRAPDSRSRAEPLGTTAFTFAARPFTSAPKQGAEVFHFAVIACLDSACKYHGEPARGALLSPEMRGMTPGETYAFMYGARLLEVTPVFTVTDMVGFARDEIHAHAFWSVRVDGQIYGSFEIADLAARGPRLEGLVVGWYQRERARRADREEWSG